MVPPTKRSAEAATTMALAIQAVDGAPAASTIAPLPSEKAVFAAESASAGQANWQIASPA